MKNNLFINDLGKVKIRLVKLGYNEAKKSVVAKRVLDFDGKREEKLVKETDDIVKLIRILVEQEQVSVEELIKRQLIVVSDDRLLNEGVIVQSGESYKKIAFDTHNGEFVEKRLTRAENISLGIIKNTPEEEVVHTEGHDIEKHEVETHETERHEVETHETGEDTMGRHGDADFYYDAESGTLRSGRETEGSHTIIPTGIPVEGTVGDSDVHAIINMPPSDPNAETNDKKHKIVKALKVCGAIALLAGTIFLVRRCSDAFENAKEKSNTGDGKTRNEQGLDATPMPTTFTTPEPSVITPEPLIIPTVAPTAAPTAPEFPNTIVEPAGESVEFEEGLGNLVFDNMEDQLQYIIDDCFSYEQCPFQNIVVASEVPTIKAISDARNRVIKNGLQKDEVEALMHEYVRYMNEEKSTFNDKKVKEYLDLKLYSKYIVIVSGQSLLQLCPDYDYDGFDYMILTNMFNEAFDATRSEILGRTKTK